MFSFFRFGLILALVGVVVGGYAAVKGFSTANNAVNESNAKGGDSDSMFHANRLDDALSKVSGKTNGDALQVAIYPGYVVVDGSTGNEDKGRSFRVGHNLNVKELPLSLTGPGRLKDNVFKLADLKGATVQKIAEETAAKEHVNLDAVTHILAWIAPNTGKPTINVYTTTGKYWLANLDGSGFSNPDQQARKAIDNASKAVDSATKAADSAASGAQSMAACLQAAGTDVSKIQACSK
jgi:hypothetical protein